MRYSFSISKNTILQKQNNQTMCDIGFGELPTLYTEKTPTARKAHICCECGSTINSGEKYELITGLWEGTFETFKTCCFCADVRQSARAVFDLRQDEGIVFGQLWDCVRYDWSQK